MKSLSIIVTLLSYVSFGSEGTISIKEETAWKRIPLAGYVEAQQDRVLVTNRMAEVVALPVHQGDTVEADTVLIRLQDKALQQQARALQEAEQARRSAVGQAQLQLDRMTRLAAKGAVAQVQKEASELQLKAAEAELAEVLAQQEQVEEMQSYLVITANAPGQLTELKVSIGDTAMPGHPLGRFVTHGVRTLKVILPDHLADQLDGGQWQVKAAAGKVWTGTDMLAVSSAPEAGTAQYKVYLTAPDFLVPNQRVNVQLLLPVRGIFLPKSAVEQRGNLTYVHVSQNGETARRLVKLGMPLDDGRRQVLGGLQLGEDIVAGEAGHE